MCVVEVVMCVGGGGVCGGGGDVCGGEVVCKWGCVSRRGRS